MRPRDSDYSEAICGLAAASVGFTVTTYVHSCADMGAPLAAAAEEALGNALS